MSQNPNQPRGASKCPVCGESLEGRDPVGHAQLHFPSDPMPNRSETLTARKQQAELLGREIPKE